MLFNGVQMYGIDLGGADLIQLMAETARLEATRAGYLKRGLVNTGDWRRAPAEFDESGNLLIGGHHVMAPWELPYMAALAANATANGGRILEVGFGSGMATAHINRQYGNVTHHTIIESHPQIAIMARGYAAACRWRHPATSVEVMEGMWQEVIYGLPDESFDAILYDCYPTQPHEIMNQIGTFAQQAYRLLRHNGIFTCYSDRPGTYAQQDVNQLAAAGFTPDDAHLRGQVIAISPPVGNEYCNVGHMLAPMIIK